MPTIFKFNYQFIQLLILILSTIIVFQYPKMFSTNGNKSSLWNSKESLTALFFYCPRNNQLNLNSFGTAKKPL